MAERPDVIFHLAAIVSGEAEADFDKGYRINLDGTRDLFEAVRRIGDGYRPRLVFTSSIAVFGAPFPDAIPDDFHLTPLTSYGTQKAIGELLLVRLHPPRHPRRGRHPPADDLRPPGAAEQGGLRLLLRHHPGAAGRGGGGAAGRRGRAPLARLAPLGDRVPPPRRDASRRADRPAAEPDHAGAVRHRRGADRGAAARGRGRPGRRIRREPDPGIQAMVAGWPSRFDARRARDLGFSAESSFDDIIRIHIEDELGGHFVD